MIPAVRERTDRGKCRSGRGDPGGRQHDFDFELGTWKTHPSRRRHPLTSANTWVESEVLPWSESSGTAAPPRGARGGWARRSHRMSLPAPVQSAVRPVEPKFLQPRWRHPEPPRHRGFTNGRGKFFAHETVNGRAILVRFVISDITPHSCRFEQAFSDDGGETWEVNWIANDSRVRTIARRGRRSSPRPRSPAVGPLIPIAT